MLRSRARWQGFPASAASAAHQAGSGMQARAQCLGFGSGKITVEGDQPEPGEQDLRHHRRGQPGLVELVAAGGEPADPGHLPGADGVLDPGVHPVDAGNCVTTTRHTEDGHDQQSE